MNLEKLYLKSNGNEIESIYGTDEFVLNNPRLNENAKVLVGFGGRLQVPRNDYPVGADYPNFEVIEKLNDLFLCALMGGSQTKDIWNVLFGEGIQA